MSREPKSVQLNTLVANIKSMYIEISQIDKKIEQLKSDDKMEKVSEIHKIKETGKLLGYSEVAAIILEGLLAYRANKYIGEEMVGMRFQGEFVNLIYLITSLGLAFLIIKGAIGLVRSSEGQSVWLKVPAYLLLLALPFINIAIDFNEPMFLGLAIMSIIVNISVVYVVATSKGYQGVDLVEVENYPALFKELIKRKKKLERKINREHLSYSLLAPDVEQEELSSEDQYIPGDVKKIFKSEGRKDFDIDGSDDQFVNWWQERFS